MRPRNIKIILKKRNGSKPVPNNPYIFQKSSGLAFDEFLRGNLEPLEYSAWYECDFVHPEPWVTSSGIC